MAKNNILPLGLNAPVDSKAKTYNTIADMQSDRKLISGQVVNLQGYYQAGDGAGHQRVIASADDGSGVQLDNQLWANIVHNGIVHSNWFGADKSGDTTDIFKKIVAYNKPTIIDSGNYELSEHIFIEEDIIKENYGNFTNKHLIYSEFLRTELPEKKQIGTFSFLGYVPETIGHQCVAYNKNTKEYILGFTALGDVKSYIFILDDKFVYKRHYEKDLGHLSSATYVPDTNQLVTAGSLREQDKGYVYIFNYDNMELAKSVNLDSNAMNNRLSFSEKEKIFTVQFYDSTLRFYDIDFNEIYRRSNKGDGYQEAVFYKGNYLYWTDTQALKDISYDTNLNSLRCYNMKDELVRDFDFEDNLYNLEAEGAYVLDDDRILVTTYAGGVVYFSEINFSKNGLNYNVLGHSLLKRIYVDAGAKEEGNGEELTPFKSLIKAWEYSQQFLNVIFYLKGDFTTQGRVKLNLRQPKATLDFEKYGDGENPVINIELAYSSVNYINFFRSREVDYLIDNTDTKTVNIATSSGVFRFEKCKVKFTNTSINESEKFWYGFLSHILFLQVEFENVGIPIYAFEGSHVCVEKCTFTNCGKMFRASNSVVQSFGNKGNTTEYVADGCSLVVTGKTILPNATTELDTPVYKNLMEQEGVYTDYANYRVAQLKYDKEQRVNEKAKQEAYEQALLTNPDLTWEDFLKTYPAPMVANVEPTIPDTVKKFMEDYL